MNTEEKKESPLEGPEQQTAQSGRVNENSENVTVATQTETPETQTETEPTPEVLLAEAQARAEKAEDRFLRTNAEFENYKKRMLREGSDRLKYFNLDLIKELLPFVDNLERAIIHAKDDSADTDSMVEGLEMVYKMTQDAFGKFGVSRVKTVGEVFDPNRHQAVGVVNSDSVPENHVAEECLGGYFLHDRIIRPAMVRVSGKA